MKFDVNKVGDVTILKLEGDLWGHTETFDLKDEANALLEKGERKFLIHIDEARRVNSTGIGVLVAIYAGIQRAEGEVKLCVSERAKAAFVVTGVGSLFEMYDTPAEALKGFGAGAAS